MPWLQLFADTDSTHAPPIEEALFRAGALSVTFKEYIPPGKSETPILEPALGEAPLWGHTRVVGLFAADCDTQLVNQHLKQENHPAATYRWEQLEDKDWEREWMQNYQPIKCANKLWICPSWIEPPEPDATNVLLDPGLAFGTGTHPTTFLCMQWLAQQNLTNSHIIDYGCGSGILAVTALLLGAQQATGVDIDPQALAASTENLQRNQLSNDRLTVHQPQDCPPTPADIMLANILAGPLVELTDTILALTKPQGKLCLSGILQSQASLVVDAYKHAIEFDPIIQKQEWVRLSGYKK